MALYKSHETGAAIELNNCASCGDSSTGCSKCASSTWLDPNNIDELVYVQGLNCQGCDAYQRVEDLVIPVDLCTLDIPFAETLTTLTGIAEDGCLAQQDVGTVIADHLKPTNITGVDGITATPNPADPFSWTIGIDLCAVAPPDGVPDSILGIDGGCVVAQSVKDFASDLVCDAIKCMPMGGLDDPEARMFVGPDCKVRQFPQLDADACKDILCDVILSFEDGATTDPSAGFYIARDCKVRPLPEFPEIPENTDTPTTITGEGGIVATPNPADPFFWTIGVDLCALNIPAGDAVTLLGLDAGGCVVFDDLEAGAGGGGGVVSQLLCAAIAAMPDGGDDSTVQYVGADCELHDLPVTHPALTVVEGDDFAFDAGAQALVIQRPKELYEADEFPANAIDGDVLITDVDTACEKRWLKCGDRDVFLSAAKSQAAALGGANGKL